MLFNPIMGIHGLTASIKSMAHNALTKVAIEDLAEKYTGSVYGVDVYSYLYPSQYNAGAKGKGSHIRTFLELIVNFWSAGIQLVFIFDGKTYSEAKKDTIDSRIARRNDTNRTIMTMVSKMSAPALASAEQQEAPLCSIVIDTATLKKLGDTMIKQGHGTKEERDALQRIMKRNIIVTNKEIEELTVLFDMVGAPYFQAEGEADFLLASMYESGVISAVLSEDKDMLTHGVGVLISGLIDADCRRTNSVMKYDLSVILTESKLTRDQFIDFCILSGCDYGPKISGVAAGKGLTYIRKFNGIPGIIEAMRSGKISQRPDKNLSIDEFEAQYNETFNIFSTRQEEGPPVLDVEYHIHPDLSVWLLSNTSYTKPTVEKKIQALSSAPVPTPVPTLTIKDPPQRVKPIVRTQTELLPKVKVKVKVKAKSIE